MQKVHVSLLVPGMKLAEPVLTGSDDALLWVGHTLTVRTIKLLRQHRIEYVFIEECSEFESVELSPVELVPAECRARAISRVWATFEKAIHSKPVAHSPEIQETARELVNFLTKHKRLIRSISEIRSVDEYLLEHSVNVSAMAIMTGTCLGMDEDELYMLGICGLMHDIGKIKVPPEILNKPARLTEEEYKEVQKHTLYALDVLGYDEVAAKVASQHHERYDGSGYPYKLVKGEIHPYAQIIGLVDVYDALTVDRCYRSACQAREVIELVAATGNYHYDYTIVRAFLSNIAPYPVGTKVLLSNGQTALVVSSAQHFPIYPKVRLLTDEQGQPLPVYEDVDLQFGSKGLFIEKQLPS